MYEFHLHRTSDRAYLGRMDNAFSRNFSDTLNNPGAAAFSLYLDDPMAYLLDSWATYIAITQDGFQRWEGPVVNLTEDAASNTVQANCMGWFEFLNRRVTRTDMNFTGNKDLGQMAGILLSHTALYDGALPFATGNVFEAGFTIPNYQILKGAYIGHEIKKFTEWENGMDFVFDTVFRRFEWVDARGAYNANLVFGYNTGPENLENITRSIDGANMRNRVTVQGRHGNPYQASDAASIASRGAHIELITITGITGNEAQGLAAYANAEIAVRGNPIITYNVVPKGYSSDVYVPQPYTDFDIGDTGRVSVNKGRFQVDNQMVRIFGFSVDINESGNGRLTSVALQP